jgi:hypothetical protein
MTSARSDYVNWKQNKKMTTVRSDYAGKFWKQKQKK